jgi:ABC-2 type transport system permease protein
VVLGKFFAALSVVLLMLVLTLLYPVLARYAAGDQLEYAAVMCGYVGVFLMGTAFISTGIFLSSLTENQIVAAVITFGTLLMFWIIGWASQLTEGLRVPIRILKITILTIDFSAILEQISILNHFEDFSKGVLDTGHVAYYLLFSVFFIFLTLRVLESNKWRG